MDYIKSVYDDLQALPAAAAAARPSEVEIVSMDMWNRLIFTITQ